MGTENQMNAEADTTHGKSNMHDERQGEEGRRRLRLDPGLHILPKKVLHIRAHEGGHGARE